MRDKPLDIIPLSRLAFIERDKITRTMIAKSKKRHKRRKAKQAMILASELSNYEKRLTEPWPIVRKT